MLIIEIRDNAISIIQAESKLNVFNIKKSQIIEFADTWKTYITNPENISALTQILRATKESKALLCLNTTSVIYRDMIVPKASPQYLATMIHHELNHALNLSNDYLMDYTILGEAIKNEKKMHKILVTAILAPVLNEYIEFFEKAGLQIIKVDASLNSIQKYVDITKLVSKDNNTLVADINNVNIRQYLFEKGKYSYYRTTKTTMTEENGQTKLESTAETIEKMLQFSLSLGQNSSIDEIILFGTSPLIDQLKEYMNENSQVVTLVMPRPKLLGDPKHDPFKHELVYALGLLFSQRYKRKKDINLIMSYNTYYSHSSSSINFDALYNSLAFGLGYLALFGIIITILQTNMVNANIKKINDYFNRPEIIKTLAEIAEMKTNIASLNTITGELDGIQKVLDSIPRYTEIKINTLLSVKPLGLNLTKISFTDNVITIAISAYDPSTIHEYVLSLMDLAAFSDITYTSYQFESSTKSYSSEISLTLQGEPVNENN